MEELVHLTVVGSLGVGKSSFSLQFACNVFVEAYDPTIEEHYRRQVAVDESVVVVDVLDTAGRQNDFPIGWIGLLMQRRPGLLIMYSITSKKSLEAAKEFYKTEIEPRLGDFDLAIAVAGNKCDLESQREVSYEEGLNFAREIGASFFEMSAKTRMNVDEVVFELVRDVKKKGLSAPLPEKKKGFKAFLKSIFRATQ